MKSKKLYLALIIGVLLAFLTLSSWLGNSGLVGRFGVWFAALNKKYFGYLSFINLPYLAWVLFLLYRAKNPFTEIILEKTLGHLLGILSLLFLQSSLLNQGEIGNSARLFLRPFIGDFGLYALIMLMVVISYLILFKLPPKSVFYPYMNKTQNLLKEIYKQCLQAFSPNFSLKKEGFENTLSDLQKKETNNPKEKENLKENPIDENHKPPNEESFLAIPTPYNTTLNDSEPQEGLVQISPHPPTHYTIYPKKNRFDDLANPTLKEIQQETKEREPTLKKETPTTLKPIMPISAPNTENDNKTENHKTPNHPIKEDDLQENPQKENQKENIEEKESLKEEEKETENAPNFSPITPTSAKKPVMVKELSENKEILDGLDYGEVQKPKDYELPTTQLLNAVCLKETSLDENEIDQKIQDLLSKLRTFKIDGDIIRTYSGPIVTTFEFRPAPSVKVSRILGLSDDLAMTLCAESIRIQAPIKGKDVVGIEIPNSQSQIIYLREILESELFQKSSSPLTLALGKDIVGNPFITDLKKLPHLLIAGTTGSGKSVGVNAMILSLLYKNPPDQLKLVMIDPKMVEFSIYADIPHLLTPIITDPKKAIGALQSVAKEMERRYSLMSEYKVKTIDSYNEQAQSNGVEAFPYLIVVIDELADLMMTGGKEAEFPIARIAQMGRASGLHLIVATQRPSVDVVTGLIKTNLPSRVSFRVGTKIDSKVILDTDGAQSLLGRGDMLFTPPGANGLVRLHAPFATEDEIKKIVDFIKAQKEVQYDKDFLLEESRMPLDTPNYQGDDILERAKAVILEKKITSTSFLQRQLKIGYNQAATITDELEAQGFLSPRNAKGNREILQNF
ncbi:DNA translocase FtsK [Helicobacter pylori]|uniref:DNA translocase FtsK n=1 Tax=Helicobacter pylori TaxID=210 RepID=UPI0002BB2621|nr:DNA translocase FtsK [Helicobacter pylori]EMH10098.1 FtsK/SpoIIIE family protein [Helicobacter pylori GAM250AFi]EMH14605.1 FtsK/SpoIIIE family protein [Helicobacter pylori GAM252Bi]EMH15495.1 FtsK/SpoIIIE family protein [Helicobacter pylori GAM252T]EMH47825.1 FtsK/SpoIIIE family protein [Helicobacter pylori HP250AFii]EMH48373.1 FtsK/SpoIIIE family protein [Helicobacter pylori HP250AFiii]